MATILVVDDHAVNRDFLDTLLRYAGHEVVQAADGAQALELVRSRHPDLVITDVLMPNMDGVEFADRVHSEADIAETPIIFYTATYRDPEARVLADSCGVEIVLIKPAEPQALLDAVAQALGTGPAPALVPEKAATYPSFLAAKIPLHMHDLVALQARLRRMFDEANESVDAGKRSAHASDDITDSFHLLSLRLTRLLELNLEMSSERNSERMLTHFCSLSREIMNCTYAGVGILDEESQRVKRWTTMGLDEEAQKLFASLDPHAGALGQVITSGKAYRVRDQSGQATTLGLPAFHPAITSLLVVPVPVRSPKPLVGWLYFADKLRDGAFDNEDEQFAATLAAQLSMAYGNLCLYEEIQQHAAKLQIEVTERRRAQDELAHRMTHDQTTGLPRFELIEEHLRAAIVSAAARDGRILVLYADIDHFHVINETRGRAIGDHVLRTIGRRFNKMLGNRGWLAHVAGDEFAAVLVDTTDIEDQLDFAEAMRLVVEGPIEHAEDRIYITCSVGVSCYPDNGVTPQELLWEAETAMLRSKREGRNTVSAFSNEEKQLLEERRALGAQLRNAIRDDQLVIHYQPQISGQDWQILGFEALVRWQHPEFGLLAPSRFIPVAEQLGLIVDVGSFVIDSVCQQIRAWMDSGVSDFIVSINVASLQLQRPNFVDNIRTSLSKWNLPGRYLELELIESAVTDSIAHVASTMRALKSLGVRIALDDFGTGYSSLNYLRHFPTDKLKIDQSFVRDITSDASSAGICRAIISLGHQMGMSVLAEGVEDAAQVSYLLRNECDSFQGFYFSKPVVASQALTMLGHRYITQDALLKPKEENTLLLVDDEENILRALSRALRRDGYQILTAMGAREAFDLLAKNQVQVIISDQRMPDISGTEFLSKVKEMYPETVRIVLSGYTDLEAVTDAINRGAIYKFLTKPWNDGELRTQVREAFRMRKSRVGAL